MSGNKMPLDKIDKQNGLDDGKKSSQPYFEWS